MLNGVIVYLIPFSCMHCSSLLYKFKGQIFIGRPNREEISHTDTPIALMIICSSLM